MPNPFGLVTDADLSRSWPAIEAHWCTAESGSFSGVGNIEIEYVAFYHPHSVGAVVVSSGRTESYIKYKELAYDLHRQGYSVFIHDHRGQGFSDRLTKDPHQGFVDHFDDYVSDLKTFYQTVITRRPQPRLFLLAHSMGAGIATLYIERYVDDFHAAALLSPMYAPNTGIANSIAYGIAATFVRTRKLLSFLFGNEPAYALLQGRHKNKSFKPNTRLMLTHCQKRFAAVQSLFDQFPLAKLGGVTNEWLLATKQATQQILADVDNIRIPVLIVQAGADIAVRADAQQVFCDALNRAPASSEALPLCRLEVVEGGYHELYLESDKYRLPAVNLVLRFFEQHRL